MSDSAPLTRRDFVATSAGALVAVAGSGPFRVPSARRLDRVGIQLYTLRQAMARDVAGTLGRLAEMGYREVEFAGYFDHAPSDIRGMLDASGLASPATHVGFETLGDGWASVLEASTTIGHTYVVVPFLPQDRRTPDGYRRVAEMFNRAAESARAAGLRFGYHNHAFEFEPLDGGIGFDILLDECDPNLVEFEMDLFWITHGGGDPLAYFARAPGRFPLVHVKDRTPAGEMVDVGAGAIDFAAIFARASQAGIRHYFVEHDRPDEAFASARRSLEHLRAMR